MWNPTGICDSSNTHKLQNYAVLTDRSLSAEQQITYVYGKQNHSGQTIHTENPYRTGLVS